MEVLISLKCVTLIKFNIWIAVMSVCQQEISIWSIISYLTCISDNFTHNVVCRRVTGGSCRDFWCHSQIIEMERGGGANLIQAQDIIKRGNNINKSCSDLFWISCRWNWLRMNGTSVQQHSAHKITDPCKFYPIWGKSEEHACNRILKLQFTMLVAVARAASYHNCSAPFSF